MATKTRIKVSENEEVIARFVNTGDAQRFAEVATEDLDMAGGIRFINERILTVTDNAGWVNLTYRHGYTLDIT